VVSPAANLSGYKMVIAPALALLNEEEAQNLNRYAEQGGLLVLTVRCAQKDTHNALFPALQPGPLRAAAGAEVEEYFALDTPVPVTLNLPGQPEQSGLCDTWAEMLRPLDAGTTIAAQFGESNGWLDSAPAITLSPPNAAGGRVAMIGALLDEASQDAVMHWLLQLTELKPTWPNRYEGIEFARRWHPDGRSVLFVINHTRQPARVALPTDWCAEDLITGRSESQFLQLEPYGVRVFEGGIVEN
jgi:beta-galactosidase